MVGEPVTQQDVDRHLNTLEKLTSYFESEDDYQAAMLQNQEILIKLLQGSGPGVYDSPLGGLDLDDLPEGIAGEAISSADSGERVRAVFSVRGTRFVSKVSVDEEVQVGDVLYITGKGNEAILATNAEVTTLFGGSLGFSSGAFERTETGENVTIEAGEYKDVLQVDVDDTAWLWEVGTNDETYTEYQYLKDGEEILEDRLKEPLGLYNDPFRFPVPRKFTDTFIVRVYRQNDAPGSAEYFSKATYMVQ